MALVSMVWWYMVMTAFGDVTSQLPATNPIGLFHGNQSQREPESKNIYIYIYIYIFFTLTCQGRSVVVKGSDRQGRVSRVFMFLSKK